MARTLTGIRIVSTAVNIPGPVAAALLRDIGGTVVKVEPPGGDPLATYALAWYTELCAGMEVQRLDLKSDDGRARLEELLAGADVLLTASRPSSLRRLGLSWAAVHARHPRLCHVAIVGYPPPRQDDAGHDVTYQAEAGLLTPPAMPRSLLADLAGAQRAVIATFDLLFARERRGTAGYADVVLAECADLFAQPLRHGLTSSTGRLGGTDAAYNIYPARGGWVVVAALEPQFRTALGRELGVDVEDRAALARVFADRPARDWARWAETRGLPLVAMTG